MSNGVFFIIISALCSAIIFISGSPVSGDDARLVSISYSRPANNDKLEENREYAGGGYFYHTEKVKKYYLEKSRKNNNPYNIDPYKKPRNPYKTDSRKKTINYKVIKGDTLFSVSRKFGIPFNVLCSLNDFSGEEKIKTGAIIKVPASEKAEKKENAAAADDNSAKKNNRDNSSNKKVLFGWPVKEVKNFRQDGADGIKPIGIIITGNPGAKVYPSADGTVEKIGNMRGFGKYIVMRHDGKFVTVYSNLDKISVTEGQKITTKSSIGKIDHSNGKFHFQIDYAGKPKNPTSYLPAKS